MKNYFTQKEAARKGIITPKMKEVLSFESISSEELLLKISQGRIVIPANINHKSLKAKGVGEGLKTKVNVNIGVSEECCNIDNEINKLQISIKNNADSIMDLSVWGNTSIFRKKIIELSPLMVGTVPMYDAVAKYGKDIKSITEEDFFNVVESHCEDGVDFITIHAGLTITAAERIDKNKRLTGIVSRGGSILFEWMKRNNKENPFYSNFERLLDICKKYDVTLSLGDGLRPGSINDSTDSPQIQELIFLGELTKRAWEADVQVMIEGPGHIPLNEISSNILLEKKLCHNAPFYVLGPIVTDIAPGYDHITSAIGGAIAAAAGADFLCYVTPAEHLRLPDENDVKEGLIAARIAAHAADIAKGIKGSTEWDKRMSKARFSFNWKEMIDTAIDPEKAIKYRKTSLNGKMIETCTMCGDLCPMKRVGDLC